MATLSTSLSGPLRDWLVQPHGDAYALYSGRGNERHGITLVYLKEPDSNRDAVFALIAAAPDLYAALDAALAYVAKYESEHESNAALDVYAAATAALAKARGEK